jgi:hypothetical protein
MHEVVVSIRICVHVVVAVAVVGEEEEEVTHSPPLGGIEVVVP